MSHFKTNSSVYLILGLMIVCSACHTFDSEKWIKMEDKHQREPMLKDLCKNYLVIGNDRNDMIKLLGKPDGEMDSIHKGVIWGRKMFLHGTDQNLIKKDSLLYLFYSEPCSRLFINIDSYICGFNGSGPDYLFVVYDKNNKLIDYKLGMTIF